MSRPNAQAPQMGHACGGAATVHPLCAMFAPAAKSHRAACNPHLARAWDRRASRCCCAASSAGSHHPAGAARTRAEGGEGCRGARTQRRIDASQPQPNQQTSATCITSQKRVIAPGEWLTWPARASAGRNQPANACSGRTIGSLPRAQPPRSQLLLPSTTTAIVGLQPGDAARHRPGCRQSIALCQQHSP
jgi:hypothetical protein